MKKFFKYFLLGIVLCLGLVAFSFTDNVMPFICHAVTPETCRVNFYGADNETIIYSNEIEAGSTLNEIKSRNLFHINQDYSNYVDNSTSYTTASVSNQNITFHLVSGSSYHDLLVCYIDPVLIKANTHYYIKFYNAYGVNCPPDDIIPPNFWSFWFFKSSLYDRQDLFFDKDISCLDLYFTSDIILNGVGTYHGNPSVSQNVDFTFSISIEQDFSYEPYFDDFNSYINEEFLKSAGVSDYSTNVSWSISPNSDSKFSFDSPLNHDYNFYGFIDNGTTYDYSGNVDARLSEIGDYAIKDIVSFNINGFYLYKYTIDFNSFFFLRLLTSNTTTFSTTAKSFILNSDSSYFDFNVAVVSSDLLNFSCSAYTPPMAISSVYTYNISASGSISATFYFSNYSFYFNTSNSFYLVNDADARTSFYIFENDLYKLVDMNSDTNFSYSLLNDYSIWNGHDDFNYLSYFLNYSLLNPNSQSDIDTYHIPSSDTNSSWSLRVWLSNGGETVYNDGSYLYFLKFFDILNYQSFDYYDLECSYIVKNYYFVIDKPSYRVNNSLCIYNFDYYNTLYNISSLTYELQKGGDYYDVTYSGTVPNSKFLYFDCPEIDNTIFDRYVFLYLNLSNTKINLLENNNYIEYFVGFDFNFIYYNQPLITSNGVYPYSFDTPKYKDMSITFSLVPPELVIPWNSIFYNAVVFLCFYMPLVSDINNAIGLNYFIGALLNIIDFVFDSAIGSFISGCIAFLILFALMKLLFPFVYSVGVSSYNKFSGYLADNDNYINNGKYYRKLLKSQQLYDSKHKLKGHHFKSSERTFKNKQYLFYRRLKGFKFEGYYGKRNNRFKRAIILGSKHALRQKGYIK